MAKTRRQELGRRGELWLNREAQSRGWEVADANLENPNNPAFDATLTSGDERIRIQIKTTDSCAGKLTYREWSFKPQTIPYPYLLVDLSEEVPYSIVFHADVVDSYIKQTVEEFIERNPKPERTVQRLMNNVCHLRVLRSAADVSRLKRTCLREDQGFKLDELFKHSRPSR